MFQGHHGAALFISAFSAESVPLWILFLLSQWTDIFYVFLSFILRVEIIEKPLQRDNAVLQYRLLHVPYSHGLIPNVAWAVAVRALFTSKRAKNAASLAVISHWILDFIVHVPDLDVCFPFNCSIKVGLGLWKWLWPSVIFESAICASGALAYVCLIKEGTRRRKAGMRLGVLVIIMISMTVAMPFAEAPAEFGWKDAIQMYVVYAILALFAYGVESSK